ncbi:hypothetical protein BpHYR1_039761 [Brachionus plicatilis]|uniref:Uncharacterized protein n=1 Tax=Brachionus plicatilis TaxID=10195 RepID=A0A3M7SKV2_BRAPC|nr:hypothetical protein BpHYR1_039761 [Brachionus plicatilis]
MGFKNWALTKLKKCQNFEKVKNEIEFPRSHFYTPSPKTFESRRTSLDFYMKRLIQLLGSQIPIELAKFLNLNEILDFDEEFLKRKKNTQETLNMPQISIKDLTSQQVCYSLCKADFLFMALIFRPETLTSSSFSNINFFWSSNSSLAAVRFTSLIDGLSRYGFLGNFGKEGGLAKSYSLGCINFGLSFILLRMLYLTQAESSWIDGRATNGT